MNFFEVTIFVLIIGFIVMELSIIFIISIEKGVEQGVAEKTRNWTLVRLCDDKLRWSIKRLVIDVVLFIAWVYSVTYCHWYDPGFWR